MSELIREREAKSRDHPTPVLIRNWPEPARYHPALSDVSGTMKVQPVFNPVVEYILFGQTDCLPDAIQSSLVAPQGNRVRRSRPA